MTTALVTQTTNALTTTAPALDRENLSFLASMIEQADLIPKESGVSPQVQKFRVMAKIVAGTAYGFDAISSQTNLHIINGRLTLSAIGMSVLLKRSGKYSTRVEYLNNDGCKLAVLELSAEGKWIVRGFVEFTRAHAEKAGLTTKNGSLYGKYAEDMFFARCMTRVVKRFAPEVLDGETPAYDLARRSVEPTVEQPTQDQPKELADTGEVEAVFIEVSEAVEDANSGNFDDQLTDLCKRLNASGDAIKWSQKTLASFAMTHLGYDAETPLNEMPESDKRELVNELTERLNERLAIVEADTEAK